MGGGASGRGGGDMLRAVGRTVASRAGVAAKSNNSTAPTSPTTRRKTHKLVSPHLRSFSAVSSNTNGFAVGAAPASNVIASSPPHASDVGYDSDWVCVDGVEGEEMGSGYCFDEFVFGDVPSKHEVESAVSAVQKVFDPIYYPQIWDTQSIPLEDDVSSALVHHVTSEGSELNPTGFIDHASQARAVQTYGPEKVFDAFDMLRNEPSVQKMVMSLSSDKAVWEAVLNNEVVRDIRESYMQENAALDAAEATQCPGDSLDTPHKGTTNSNIFLNAVRWFFDNTRVKLLQVIENISKLVGQIFHPIDEDVKQGSTNSFEEKLRTSFLLSIFVLMVVAVARSQKG